MTVHRITSKPEHGPFQATVGTDGEFESGMIRIVPPFVPGQDVIDIGDSEDTDLTHTATTDYATLFNYAIRPHRQGNQAENIERIEAVLNVVLEYLGHTASADSFYQYWEKY